jgi:hypothetical protein
VVVSTDYAYSRSAETPGSRTDRKSPAIEPIVDRARIRGEQSRHRAPDRSILANFGFVWHAEGALTDKPSLCLGFVSRDMAFRVLGKVQSVDEIA